MTDPKNYNGLLIGTIFTIVSLLLTMTFIVPMISVLPGIFFETLSSALISNDPYSNVGKLTILLLSITLVLTLVLFFINIKRTTAKNGTVSKGRIVLLMTICYFIAHSLFFYIYWGLELGFRNDGQLIFGAVKSFPISSFTFIFIGLLIDIVKNSSANGSLAKAGLNESQ